MSSNMFKILLIFSIINVANMFGFCFCSRSKRSTFTPSSKHYADIQKTLSDDEQVMLELIYADLASRNNQNLLTIQNFLVFFNLTGLWGAKLFRQFDEECRKLITKEQFFYGLSRTAKAPHQEKIKLLFNFFKDDEDNGIKFIDFTKMLYNYSRDQLKEILLEDTRMVSELNPTISKNISDSGQDHSSNSMCSMQSILRRDTTDTKKKQIIELNYQEPKMENISCFQKNYAEFSQYRDPGTILEVKLNQLTYKVNYCNMITLVKQFAKKIYLSYQIDIKSGKFNFQKFSLWIQSHKKLFESYYTSFHVDLWSYSDGEPSFLTKIEKSFTGKLSYCRKLRSIYAMLVGDILVIAKNHKQRKTPFKVVCLEGLNMIEVFDENGYGIEIKHRDEYYTKCTLYFKNKVQQQDYLESFRVYEGDSLHDLYNSHQMIGTGKFSIVYRCTSKQKGKSYALKDISTQKLTPQAIATINNESQIMKIISHPQIVKYKETIHSKSHIYIIAQYIYGKDLYQYVKKRKRLTEYISAFIIGKIIGATIYLHSLEIIHRDLKPENIMVMLKKKNQNLNHSGQSLSDEQSIENIKIIDFGLSNHLSQLQNNTEKHGIAGTPNYIAPQVILGETPSYKADNFSIGSILYFLLSGKLAFAFKSMNCTLLKTARGQYDMSDSVWQQVSDQAKDLINKLLHVDPEERIGLQDALNHPWFDVVTKRDKSPKNALSICNDNVIVNLRKQSEEIKLETICQIDVQKIVELQMCSKLRKSRL